MELGGVEDALVVLPVEPREIVLGRPSRHLDGVPILPRHRPVGCLQVFAHLHTRADPQDDGADELPPQRPGDGEAGHGDARPLGNGLDGLRRPVPLGMPEARAIHLHPALHPRPLGRLGQSLVLPGQESGAEDAVAGEPDPARDGGRNHLLLQLPVDRTVDVLPRHQGGEVQPAA